MDIFKAAAGGDVGQLVSVLEECPHDINERNWLWQTPLIVACIYNQYEAAKTLIERGADILAQDHESGWTALHHCMYRGHFAIGALIVKTRPNHWNAASPTHTPIKPHVSRRRSSGKKKLKRGTTAFSRHGFKYRVTSPLEMEDYNKKRPYDLVSCPCVHGGSFSALERTNQPEPEPKYNNNFSVRGFEAKVYGFYNGERREKEERLRYDWLVYSFGIGTNYQLGYSTQQSQQVKPKRIEVLDGLGVREINADTCSCFAISKDGHCYSWGLGYGGRLGLGNSPPLSGKTGSQTTPISDSPSPSPPFQPYGQRRRLQSGRFQIEPCRMKAFGDRCLHRVSSHGELGSALTSGGSLFVWGTIKMQLTDPSFSGIFRTPSKDSIKDINDTMVSVSSQISPEGNSPAVTPELRPMGLSNGYLPRKVQHTVKFREISVSSNRICLVSSDRRLYLMGQGLLQEQYFSSPSLCKEYSNVNSAISTAWSVLILTYQGEVFQQDQGSHSYRKVQFPKCRGYDQQVLFQCRISGDNTRNINRIVQISSISADPGGRHALGVSTLGNLYGWSLQPNPNITFPVRMGSNWEGLKRESKGGIVRSGSSPRMSPLFGPVSYESPVLYGKAKLSKRHKKPKPNRIIASLVPGLSRVNVRQASIAAHHAALVTACGDLYTWGTGCIGHGKQSIILVPTRVHRLRQIASVSVSDGHTIAVQRVCIPVPISSESSLLYDDPHAIGSDSTKMLQRLCEEKLTQSLDLVSPITIFKCYRMAFRLGLPRLVRYCTRFILLNHKFLIPQSIKTLSKAELQQIDFYHHLWTSDPFLDLNSSTVVERLKKNIPSHLHPNLYPDNCNDENSSENRVEEIKLSPHLSDFRSSPGDMKSIALTDDLVEIYTGDDGKKHTRVVLRVKKRYKELRKKLKQIINLKNNKKELEDDQKAKVAKESMFEKELNGLRTALRHYAAGREFLEKIKGGNSWNTPKSGPAHPPRRSSTSRPSPPILSNGVSDGLMPPLSLLTSQTPDAKNLRTGGSSEKTNSGDSGPRERTLSTFERIQLEQLTEARIRNKGVRKLFPTPTPPQKPRQNHPNSDGKTWRFHPNPAQHHSESNAPWQSQVNRRTKKNSSPASSPLSEASFPELDLKPLSLPKPLRLSDFMLKTSGTVSNSSSNSNSNSNSKSNSNTSHSSIPQSRSLAHQNSSSLGDSSLKSQGQGMGGWSLLGIVGSSKPSSLLDIQKEQKKQEIKRPLRSSVVSPSSMELEGKLSGLNPTTGSLIEDMYAPPKASIGAVFVKKRGKKASQGGARSSNISKKSSSDNTGSRGFSWKTASRPAAESKRLKLSPSLTASCPCNNKSFSDIMREQQRQIQPPNQTAAPPSDPPQPSAWIRPVIRNISSDNHSRLEDIQSQQLIEEVQREEKKRLENRRRRRRSKSHKKRSSGAPNHSHRNGAKEERGDQRKKRGGARGTKSKSPSHGWNMFLIFDIYVYIYIYAFFSSDEFIF
ncbi:hypothetical protein AAMO2058_001467700 [Amorphochlora amoebiformis]